MAARERQERKGRGLFAISAISCGQSPADVGDLFDNRLIFGDNLLALKALEQEFAGKVKCVYIDPPYNTGSAFTHYDDGVEHSICLSLMRDRLDIPRHLSGSLREPRSPSSEAPPQTDQCALGLTEPAKTERQVAVPMRGWPVGAWRTPQKLDGTGQTAFHRL